MCVDNSCTILSKFIQLDAQTVLSVKLNSGLLGMIFISISNIIRRT